MLVACAGGDPERPGLHKDATFNHPLGEINFWVPFTKTEGDNTIWTESAVDAGDFHPVLTDNGNMLRFYGNQVCVHAGALLGLRVCGHAPVLTGAHAQGRACRLHHPAVWWW